MCIFILCSEGNQTAVLSKLDNYLQGKLKGHDIPSGPFLDLSIFLSDAILSWCKPDGKSNTCVYDVSQAAKVLGFNLWTYGSDWKGLVEVAEDMFDLMDMVNSSVLVEHSRLGALRAFILALTVYKENVSPYPFDF